MEIDLDSPSGRLRWAREQAGFSEAADFARAVGVKEVTYRAHESGQNGFARHADRYAEKLKVEPSWLLYGGETTAPAPLVNARVLARLLFSLGPSIPKTGITEKAAEALAVGLSHGLELLSETGASDPTDREFAMAVRAATSRFREAYDA